MKNEDTTMNFSDILFVFLKIAFIGLSVTAALNSGWIGAALFLSIATWLGYGVYQDVRYIIKDRK